MSERRVMMRQPAGMTRRRKGGTTRQQELEGSTSRFDATASRRDERTRGWSNKRMRKGDATITSLRNKRTRGWNKSIIFLSS